MHHMTGAWRLGESETTLNESWCAMPRSTHRSRPITVDGLSLRWRVNWPPSPPNPEGWMVQVTVFSVDGGSSRLLSGTCDPGGDIPQITSHFQPHQVEAI